MFKVDVVQIVLDLADNIVPQLEAGVAGHALGADSGNTASTFVTAAPNRAFSAHTLPCGAVTLKSLYTQRETPQIGRASGRECVCRLG